MKTFSMLFLCFALFGAACGSDEEAVDTGSDDATSSGALVDGGLNVTDALATDATGVLAVKGFLVADANGVRLCEALAESFPPQCGGSSLVLDGVTSDDVSDIVGSQGEVSEEQGVSWTDHTISLVGELSGDRFTISTTSN